MASAGPHLLSLPLELRRMIYSYLHHEIILTWPWNFIPSDHEDCHRYKDDAIRLTMHIAPLLNVLLTHPQLHEEYLQADCYKRPSVHFQRSSRKDTGPVTDMIRDPDLFQHVFSYAQILQITFSNCAEALFPRFEINDSVTTILQRIERTAPNLATAKIGLVEFVNIEGTDKVHLDHAELVEFEKNFGSDFEDAFELGFGATDQSAFLPTLPADLMGIPLYQRAEGVSIAYRDGDQLGVLHRASAAGFYVFTHNPSESRLWKCAEILDLWHEHLYPEDQLSKLPAKQARKILRMPFEFKKLKEMHGEKLTTWSAEDMDTAREHRTEYDIEVAHLYPTY